MATIRFESLHYPALPGETLLDTLLRHGAPVAHSCRKGSCGCCQVRVLEGQVEQAEAGGRAAEGHVLACVCRPAGDVALAPADLSQQPVDVELVSRMALAPGIFELELAPHRELDFRPGQHVYLVREDGVSRPYSIASLPEDGFSFRIHVREMAGGALSPWLCRGLAPGQRLKLRGPFGGFHLPATLPADVPLLLVGTGTGAGALLGVLREALARGHRGPIGFFHGVREPEDLYLDTALRLLAAAHPQLDYQACVSGGSPSPGDQAGRALDRASALFPALGEGLLFLCGHPRMVEQARVEALRAGIPRAQVFADPFTLAAGELPRDAAKLAALAPEPEIWVMLGQGPGLTRLLEDFYARVYADPKLAPFFQGVPVERAVQKQYEFLADVFTGRRSYFGLNPFNAHHWMVISDELFDHREALFEQVLLEHGVPGPLARRWLAIHELFRAELVKAAPRGLVTGGREHPVRTQVVECLDIDAVCDGCQAEIPAGAPSRYLHRIGTLHCAACAGLGTAAA
ncbi:hypothetical protein N790_13735 [Arenimonas malthae CC-JY-1]|uniref:2Fe-2S ferredoxin-type domain-containing protein n=1 Tax=Arenimonas malthae CC-JY-1 TaxID=1384054 RepID=A0A091BM30_9GAMM|nr:2Fe-2S iron-sulfur cluster-binding protein [Arenimonas malthae]KFN51859.1 hypothetical protein N790_13735 [Arenimonas malthae CC-JY-1]